VSGVRCGRGSRGGLDWCGSWMVAVLVARGRIGVVAEKISARERARAGRLARRKALAEREKKVEAAATKFFRADEAAAKARQRLDEATASRAAAVATLFELDETAETIAILCDITEQEAITLHRRAIRASRATPPPADSDTPHETAGANNNTSTTGDTTATSPTATENQQTGPSPDESAGAAVPS